MLKVLRGMKSKTEKKPEQIRETFRGGRSPTFPPAQIEIMTRSFRKPKIILINFKKKILFSAKNLSFCTAFNKTSRKRNKPKLN